MCVGIQVFHGIRLVVECRGFRENMRILQGSKMVTREEKLRNQDGCQNQRVLSSASSKFNAYIIVDNKVMEHQCSLAWSGSNKFH